MSDQAIQRTGSRFRGLSDLLRFSPCPACSQPAPNDHIYGSRHLRICSKCAVCIGPEAKDFICNLSDDRLERRVQLSMALDAATDFSKRLSSQKALAHNGNVCSLVRNMRDGLDLSLMPTQGVQ